MLNQEQLQNVSGVVGTANNILVMVGRNPSLDQVCIATSLFLGLEKLGKKVSLLSPEALDEKYTDISASDRVLTKLGHKNLHVVFDYQQEAIDKVSYHINEENQKFYLVIQPQSGFPPLDSKTVSFEYGGAEADLIFLIGVNSLEDLEHLYFNYENLYKDSATISINSFESDVANINLDFSGLTSLSEGMVELLHSLEVEIDGEMATNLLAGIEDKTDSFRSLTTSPDTFAKASSLLKAGARRIRRAKPPAQVFDSVKLEQSRKMGQVLKKTTQKSENLKIETKENTKAGKVVETKKKKDDTPIKVAKQHLDPASRQAGGQGKVGGLDHQPGHGPGGGG